MGSRAEPPPSVVDTARFTAAVAAIDAANSDDPAVIVIDGVSRPKELAHAELMTAWVQWLDPHADEAQLLAARAHHLRRWAVPRDTYPDGRAGYLRWRRDQNARHAEEVGTILGGCGYDPDTIERVAQIVRKERSAEDPAVQVHEDARCLVFLATQVAPVADRLGDARTVEVLRKTLPKMSDAARRAALELSLGPAETALLERAIAEG